MELELKHLAPYLPYNVEIYYLGTDIDFETPKFIRTKLLGVKKDEHFSSITFFFYLHGKSKEKTSYSKNPIKLILKPLSRLKQDKELIDELDKISFGTFSELYDIKNINKIPNILYQLLIENHYDVFNLIEKGLAVDINTLSVQNGR